MNTVAYAQNQQRYQITEANIEEKEGIIYYFPYENSEYFVYIEENRIIALNLKTKKELASLRFKEVVNMKLDSQNYIETIKNNISNKNSVSVRSSSLVEMYDKWTLERSTPSFSRTVAFTLEETTSINLSVSILTSFLAGLGLAIRAAATIATYIHNKQAHALYMCLFSYNIFNKINYYINFLIIYFNRSKLIIQTFLIFKFQQYLHYKILKITLR